jgi:hypothetical protein
VPYYVIPGFDKWVRVRSGLSNEKIAAALSVSADTVQGWREGEGVLDPSATLVPLRVAVKGPWPPATAEDVWQELAALIAAAEKGTPVEAPAPRVRQDKNLTPVTAPKKKAAVAQSDPQVTAIKAEIDAALEQVRVASQNAGQVSGGWFTRTSDKYKKYVPNRDLKHRKAYLEHCLSRADALLERARTRRTELATALDRLAGALRSFDELQAQCADKIRQREANAELATDLKRAAPLISMARQTHDKARTKDLLSVDEALKRAETTVQDWQSKRDAIGEPAGISLNWVGRNSRLVERLKAAASKNWAADFDPFEGNVICKDKLADSYKSGQQFNNEKPVDIDLSCEIDLTVAGTEEKQRAARDLL